MQTPTNLRYHAVTSSDSTSNLKSLSRDEVSSMTGTPRSATPTLQEESIASSGEGGRVRQKRRRRRVMVLLTGGTMAMRATGRSGSLEPAPGYLASQMRSMSELRDAKMASIHYDVIEYDPLLDSADMVPGDWSTIARDIAAHHDSYDGFVVILGTDTMAYCASALSFMLEGLGKPVVLTGSMVPFCEAHSDARRNLILSLIFAGGLVGRYRRTPAEVLVFFHDRLLRGCRASKVDALALAAFDSPNFPPLATVGVAIRDAFELGLDASRYENADNRSLSRRDGSSSSLASFEPPATTCTAMLKMETRIVVVRVVPGFDDAALAACFASSSLKAVVIEVYGTGTAPSRRRKLVDALKVAKTNGVLVVATTQCRRGGVVMDTYAVGQALLDAGVVSGGDMTTEACATKLAYLFGKYPDSVDDVRRLFETDLRGELSNPESYLRPFFEEDSDHHPLHAAPPSAGGDIHPTGLPPAPPTAAVANLAI